LYTNKSVCRGEEKGSNGEKEKREEGGGRGLGFGRAFLFAFLSLGGAPPTTTSDCLILIQ
jgi:hypothetical protein